MADEPVRTRAARHAARDYTPLRIRSRAGGVDCGVDVNVTGLAGFLLAKVAAAYGRRKEKDWYDIAFVLLHNDFGGPEGAARVTRDRFGSDLVGGTRSALDDLLANFAAPDAQGSTAFASQMVIDHPGSDAAQLRADAVVAVHSFYAGILS